MPDPFAVHQPSRKKRFIPHISAGLLAAAMSFTAPQEAPGGRPILQAYQDIVGVYTACLGHTKGVVPGKNTPRRNVTS